MSGSDLGIYTLEFLRQLSLSPTFVIKKYSPQSEFPFTPDICLCELTLRTQERAIAKGCGSALAASATEFQIKWQSKVMPVLCNLRSVLSTAALATCAYCNWTAAKQKRLKSAFLAALQSLIKCSLSMYT